MTALSVIIPAYRPRDFAQLALSMAANRDVGAEWIVVDDGSGPGYEASFAELPDSVRVIRLDSNRRQGAARNAGLAQARGSWIKFLDADDRLDEGHLAALLAAAQNGEARAIPFAPTRHVFADGRRSDNESWRDLPRDPRAQLLRQLVRPFLTHCGALFPRELLEQLGGYEESLVTDEDGDLLLRILLADHSFVPVEQVHYLYLHHDHGGRVSSDNDPAKLEARRRVCERVAAHWHGHTPADVADALAQRLDKIAMSYWTSQPAAARALLRQARTLAPDYRPDIRTPLRVLRALGGPHAVFAAQHLYRRLRGRPKGGYQG